VQTTLKPNQMGSNMNKNNKRGRVSSEFTMASPPSTGSYCDYAMMPVDQMMGPRMQQVTFQQPATFSSALLTGAMPQQHTYIDQGQPVYQHAYPMESSSFDFSDGGGQGGVGGSQQQLAPDFSIGSDTLHAFGVTDYEDQVRIARMFQFLSDMSFGGVMSEVFGRLFRYMKSFTASSRKIHEAKEALELEKQKLVAELEAKEMEVTTTGMIKDQHYQPIIEALENELRQKGLDIENLQSSHATDISRLQRDCESARNEMDRVQRMCDEKDAELAALRKQNESLQSSSAEIKSLRERVEALDSQNTVLVQAQVLSQPLVDNINNLRVFGKYHEPGTGEEVVCPVMCSSGVVASMKSVISAWAKSGGGSDGNVERTFKCFETGKDVTVVSRPVFEAFWVISTAVCVNMEPPCAFEYSVDGDLVSFPVYDVLAIASRVCKIYRDGCGDDEKMMMLKGGTLIMFSLSDAEYSERKRLSFAVQKMIPGSASAVYSGIFRITDRSWNPFVNMDFVGM
jgi:hypothetical protein